MFAARDRDSMPVRGPTGGCLLTAQAGAGTGRHGSPHPGHPVRHPAGPRRGAAGRLPRGQGDGAPPARPRRAPCRGASPPIAREVSQSPISVLHGAPERQTESLTL